MSGAVVAVLTRRVDVAGVDAVVADAELVVVGAGGCCFGSGGVDDGGCGVVWQ